MSSNYINLFNFEKQIVFIGITKTNLIWKKCIYLIILILIDES